MHTFDFDIFYRAAHELLLGNSPYLVDGMLSPLPLALFFIPFALFPKGIAYFLYLALSLWLLWKVTEHRFLLALLFFPVFFTLFVGQVDLLLTLSTLLLGPYSLPLLLAKPQLGFVLFPWLLFRSKPKHLVAAITLALLLLGTCFLVRPNWIAEWRAVIPSVADYSARDSNLYWFIPPRLGDSLIWVISPLILVTGILLHRRRDSWIVLHLLVPISNIYSAVTLIEWIGPIEIVLSWLVIMSTDGNLHNGAPMWMIGISIVVRRLISLKRHMGDDARYIRTVTV